MGGTRTLEIFWKPIEHTGAAALPPNPPAPPDRRHDGGGAGRSPGGGGVPGGRPPDRSPPAGPAGRAGPKQLRGPAAAARTGDDEQPRTRKNILKSRYKLVKPLCRNGFTFCTSDFSIS